ncbi:ABC transporter A family member 2 [Micractinium conductrix]|uniref:ABC transporter A family member 2 n=1 Tax=Micractinium conductrix TaxID=554055 RepID=A0A2P6VHX3_9CHLO|nr:ABC transporter A family member 2 [Micractinium conductrix]|eukprot:PSC73682.1 ABC transporter A family member 2 [Micractinium conductrix]
MSRSGSGKDDIKSWLGTGSSLPPSANGAGDATRAPLDDETIAALLHRPWGRRFATQFAALTKKNLLVNWRNLRSTVLRVLAPLFFMLLLFLTDVALTADNPKRPYAVSNRSPEVDAVAPIPPCESDFYARTPCWDFFWTAPNGTAQQLAAYETVRDVVVPHIMAANPGRPISPDQVLQFSDPSAANAWLVANPERCPGGIHFSFPEEAQALGQFAFTLQVNQTVKYFKDKFQDPTFFFQVPLQVAVERALATHYFRNTSNLAAGWELGWDVSSSMFAHPTTNSLNIVGQVIGGFVFASNLFSTVLVLSGIVAEREQGLRQALKTMGMLESAFWLSWLAVEVLAAVLFALLLIAFGAMFQFQFFLINSFGLVFLLFFLFQLAMTSFSFMVSTMISKSSTAVVIGFVLFLIGWIFQTVVVFGFPYKPDYSSKYAWATAIFSPMPWCPLAKAAEDLGAASEDESSWGISWANRKDYCLNIPDPAAQAAAYVPGVYQNFECVMPLPTVFVILALEFVIYFLLAVFLDHVLADENGVRKGRPWYFLSPSYWCGASWRPRRHAGVRTARGERSLRPPLARGAALDAGTQRDTDVVAEEKRMHDLLEQRSGEGGSLAAQADATNAVEVFGLQKVFHAPRCKGCCSCSCLCCGCGATPAGGGRRRAPRPREFWAIKGSWFAIERGRLFCLLGPNGAGKTTTINCLTGVLPPSGGDALVYGESLGTPGGMDRIRSLMGVCPQFDVLWGELTGLEHLRLYGEIKGLPKGQVEQQVGELLAAVKLTSAGDQRTSAYSGGMRRRLSVAIALLGDPLIVYLDEPTTGMDPISRRHVWDIIEASKPGRAIVLTTHSMEEADILGDQIAIMARGRLRAIGSSLRLKQRFGSGYQLSVSVRPPGMPRTASMPDSTLADGGVSINGVSVNGGSVRGAVPGAAAALKRLFKEDLGVEPTDESKAYITFLVPKAREPQLPAFLQQLDDKRQQLGITDVQICLTSLEEVFLAIARQAEVEAAVAEGREDVTVELEGGAGSLEVALGDEYATHPVTGQHYRVLWTSDDTGRLQVLRAVPVDSLPAGRANGSSMPRGAVAPGVGDSDAASSGPGSSSEAAPGAVEMSRVA